MVFTLFIDSNEAKVISYLQGKPNIVVQSLPVGDFIIGETVDTPYAILERKTYPDLSSSIVDKRYENQKLRLFATEAAYRVYIIEGSPRGKKIGALPRSTLDSAIMSAQFRDGLSVLHSVNPEHTAELLLKLQSKLPYKEKDRSNAYLSTIKTVKKDNLTPEMCYQSQLTQIPGVSANFAQQIYLSYKNMTILLVELNTNGWANLAEIMVGSRRLGNVVAKRICDYILPKEKLKIQIKSRNPN